MSADPARRYDAGTVPEDIRALVAVDAAWEADAERYRRMLIEANARTNLVGAETLADFWRRHFLDSAQLLRFAPDALTWADLGAGAGLPGIPLAILMKHRPGARVHLIESRAKRCTFLSQVVAALDLPGEAHHARAEDLGLAVEVVAARACAPLDRLLGLAKPYIDRGARALFLKGAGVDAEIAAARTQWRFEPRCTVSLSDPRGRVVEVSGVTHATRG